MRGTVAEQVRSLVERLRPEPVCDDCIIDKLKLTVRQPVSDITRELAGTAGFERQIGTCTLCGATKRVMRRKGR